MSKSEYLHTCKRCGHEYNYDQDPPEGATMYWEPKCPECNAKMTATEVTEDWILISLSTYRQWNWEKEPEGQKEEKINEIQLWARHLHGYETEDHNGTD